MPGFSTALHRPPTQSSERSPGSGESTYHAVLPPRVCGVGAARTTRSGSRASTAAKTRKSGNWNYSRRSTPSTWRPRKPEGFPPKSAC